MISATTALRSPRGRSVIDMRPALGVALSGLTPTTEITPVTSGSCRTRSEISFCSRCISANDTSVPASVTAVIRPVSCSGRKPFGTMR